jgi:hypothetical protein
MIRAAMISSSECRSFFLILRGIEDKGSSRCSSASPFVDNQSNRTSEKKEEEEGHEEVEHPHEVLATVVVFRDLLSICNSISTSAEVGNAREDISSDVKRSTGRCGEERPEARVQGKLQPVMMRNILERVREEQKHENDTQRQQICSEEQADELPGGVASTKNFPSLRASATEDKEIGTKVCII